jgi:hypothetical protein
MSTKSVLSQFPYMSVHEQQEMKRKQMNASVIDTPTTLWNTSGKPPRKDGGNSLKLAIQHQA